MGTTCPFPGPTCADPHRSAGDKYRSRRGQVVRVRTRDVLRSRNLPRPSPEKSGNLAAAAVADARGQILDLVVGLPLLRQLGDHLLTGVQHGGVVTPTEDLADLGKRELGEIAQEVHGDLP